MRLCHTGTVTSTLTLPVVAGDLELRALTEADFIDHARLFRLPEVVRYLYEDVLHGEELRTHFEKRLWTGLPAEGEWANLAVVAGGQFLGEIGFGISDATHRTCEVGYVFSPRLVGVGTPRGRLRSRCRCALTTSMRTA